MSTESGMVLVPRIPTDEMIRAFIGIPNECANYYWSRCDGITSSYAERYARLLAAAPASPPTPALLKPAAHGDGNKKPSGQPNKPMSHGAYERANRK